MTRSRSPRRDGDSLWISRQVAGFGRYPEKTPEGLFVDEDGTINVENLMSVWGEPLELSKQEILKAIRAHMFHDEDETTLRFAIFNDDMGQIFIRVTPKRGQHRSSRECATPLRVDLPRVSSRRNHVVREPPPPPAGVRLHGVNVYERRKHPEMRGSVLQHREHGIPGSGEVVKRAEVKAPTKEQMLEMSLDDVIRKEKTIVDEVWAAEVEAAKASFIIPPRNTKPGEFYKPGVTHKVAELAEHGACPLYKVAEPCVAEPDAEPINSTTEMTQNRVAPPDTQSSIRRGGWTPAAASRIRTLPNAGADSFGAAVRSWVAWVLRSGHRQLALAIAADGWVNLDALLAAMARSPMAQSRSEFLTFDVAKLRSVLQERPTFLAKYEVEESRVRKRQQHSDRANSAPSSVAAVSQQRRCTSPAPSSPSTPRRALRREDSSCSRTPSPASGNDDDMALADICQKSLRVVGEMTTMDAREAETFQDQSAPARPTGKLMSIKTEDLDYMIDMMDAGGAQSLTPKPPPGEHWTKYEDDGMVWFHYDGPLGEWWSVGENGIPEPYPGAES